MKAILSCRDRGHSLRAFLYVLRKAGSSTLEEPHFTFPLGLPDAPVWLGSQACFCRTFPNLQIPGGAGVLECGASGVGLQGQTGDVGCSPLPTCNGLYSVFPSLKTATEALSFFFFFKDLIKKYIYLFIWPCHILVVACGIFSCGMWGLT